VAIESEDRRKNLTISLSYLCKNFETRIIVYEFDKTPKVPEILDKIDIGNTVVRHVFDNSEGQEIFHRTKFLNKMIHMTQTPVVVNYDADILLMPETYERCVKMITDGVDLVYPYFFGDSQWQVQTSGRDIVEKGLNLDELTPKDVKICRSEYGQCQFFKTSSYIAGGMENEGFISYAPEDQERAYRFQKLGYDVRWLHGSYIYHLEHYRGPNSSSLNPMMDQNNKLFEKIKKMSTEELRKYYDDIDYLKAYTKSSKRFWQFNGQPLH